MKVEVAVLGSPSLLVLVVSGRKGTLNLNGACRTYVSTNLRSVLRMQQPIVLTGRPERTVSSVGVQRRMNVNCLVSLVSI